MAKTKKIKTKDPPVEEPVAEEIIPAAQPPKQAYTHDEVYEKLLLARTDAVDWMLELLAEKKTAGILASTETVEKLSRQINSIEDRQADKKNQAKFTGTLELVFKTEED